jgi:putative membrane protein
MTRARIGVLIAALLGLAAATAVIGYIGFGAVLKAFAVLGWRGLAVLVIYSALPFALLATAWFVLSGLAAAFWTTFLAARVVRDSASELLPFSQLGGFLIGVRAAVLGGVPGHLALAATVVDVTTELIAQLGFTALGLTVLALRLGAASDHNTLITAGLTGLGFSAVMAAAFIIFQRRGMGVLEAFARRFLPAAAAGASDLGVTLRRLYARPGRLAIAVGLHLAAWIASAAGAWLALRIASVSVSLGGILALESLVFAVRSAVFVAPMGVGVQEATYAIIGPLFGLGPELSLALSLLKRARDLVIGLPALLIWQAVEGRRLVGGGAGTGD